MKLKSVVILLAIFLFSPTAHSGDGSGKITRIYAHITGPDTGVIMFSVEYHTNPPACSNPEWAFSIDTEVGKAMYSMLLTAAAQNKPVVVHGANDCAAWGDRERPQFIHLDFQ